MKNTLTLILILLAATTASFSATRTVTSNADSGAGSLREAVANANAGDEVVFASNVTSISLLSIVIHKSLTITGDATSTTVLQRDNTVTNVNWHLEIDSAATVTFNNLTFQNFYSCVGGAIYSMGNLTLNNCKILNNNAKSYAGGVFCAGELNAYNTSFENNMNGAVCCSKAHFEGCSFKRNYQQNGGAINTTNKKEVTIKNCLFEGNSASTFGGAIANHGNTTVDNCIFRKNTTTYSEAAIGNSGSIIISNSVFDANQCQSGGIFSNSYYNQIPNSATFVNCLFVNNVMYGSASSVWLGLLENNANATLSVINSTFADNKAIALAFNNYSGIGPVNTGNLYLYNNIFWNNVTPAGAAYDLYVENANSGAQDFKINASNCLIGKTNISNLSEANIMDTDPLFVGSGDYHLQENSPAINAGNNSYLPNGIASDLSAKPRIVKSTIDIGAYELQDKSLDVENASSSNTKIYSRSHWVVVENATLPIFIYDIAGQLIASGNKTEFYLPQTGLYIVRTNNDAYKIFVK